MKVYNKLVRDKIPEIIKEKGKTANYRILNDEEYRQALKDKLVEEVNEFLSAKTKEEMIEELADVNEVLFRIKVVENIDFNYFRYIQAKKEVEKGNFRKKYFLESVED